MTPCDRAAPGQHAVVHNNPSVVEVPHRAGSPPGKQLAIAELAGLVCEPTAANNIGTYYRDQPAISDAQRASVYPDDPVPRAAAVFELETFQTESSIGRDQVGLSLLRRAHLEDGTKTIPGAKNERSIFDVDRL